jgi:hypothetical protein
VLGGIYKSEIYSATVAKLWLFCVRESPWMPGKIQHGLRGSEKAER